jgi:hypothetical protein
LACLETADLPGQQEMGLRRFTRNPVNRLLALTFMLILRGLNFRRIARELGMTIAEE